ncbi:hypothetical protein D3C72_1600700 [compost metagenome]
MRRWRGLMLDSTHSLISMVAPRSAMVRTSAETSLSSRTRLRCGMNMRSSKRKIFGLTLFAASLLSVSRELSSVSTCGLSSSFIRSATFVEPPALRSASISLMRLTTRFSMIWAAVGLTSFMLTVRFMISARCSSGMVRRTLAPKEEGSMERI